MSSGPSSRTPEFEALAARIKQGGAAKYHEANAKDDGEQVTWPGWR